MPSKRFWDNPDINLPTGTAIPIKKTKKLPEVFCEELPARHLRRFIFKSAGSFSESIAPRLSLRTLIVRTRAFDVRQSYICPSHPLSKTD